MIRRFINYFIVSKRKEIPFVIFSVFLVTFLCSRIVVYLIMNDVFPEWLMLNINGVHVHHLTYGIIILAIAGFLALVDTNRKHLYKIAILYGFGLALAFDEFGMWIHLEDDYWMRLSYDAIIFLSAIFLNIIYFNFFWKKLGGYVKYVFNKTFHRRKKKEVLHISPSAHS